MADIGKDGNNLFQSIFHRAQDNRNVSSSADCFDINNSDASVGKNVNKEVSDNKHQNVDLDLSSETENEMDLDLDHDASINKPPSKEAEVLSIIPDTQSHPLKVDDSNDRLVREDPLQSASLPNESSHTHNAAVSEKPVVENGLLSDKEVKESTGSSVNNSALKSEGTKYGRSKKGISFPTDTFISGYHDPPDPWKNAPSWTPEELVAAYKKSCDIHATKPSIKIIQQLQSIAQTPGKREEVLTLKGEKLDQRQCEAIEEILRRVQFRLLDLEACHLDDECAQALFDMIEYYESACQLNMSFNKNIGVRGWQSCARLVRRTPSLTYLDMRSCELNDRTIPLFGRALKLGCHITILHMENMALAGRTLVILVAALKMNETLQELFLAENKLMPSDGVQLSNLMRYNHRLGLLDLRNNHLQDVGTSHICEGLLEQTGGRGLRTLVLWNNQINYQAMPALGKALASSETLETLNIGHNAITNEGAHLLKDGLLKTNSLLRLGLQGTRISDEGAVALAEYIADSTILLRVDLRDNDIKTGGLMALSHAMRVNTSVTRIDLDKDPKKESYMKDYAEQQGRLLRDILTFQQRNVEAALQREEEEREALERRAHAAQVQGRERKDAEGDSENQEAEIKEEEVQKTGEDGAASKSEVQPGVEAFTIIEKSEAAGQEGEATGLPISFEGEKLDNGESVAGQPHPAHLRPSQLFPQSHLCAQESLDSPLMSSSGAEDNASLHQGLQGDSGASDTQGRPQPRLNVSLEAPPAEMILSPQYVPRTMARKIFSVSRVSEEPQLSDFSPQSCSPPSMAWDPLNASAIPVALSSCPTSGTSSSGPTLPILLPPTEASAHLGQLSVSPSTALAQTLAEAGVSESLPVLPARASEDSEEAQVPISSVDTNGLQQPNSSNTSDVEFQPVLPHSTGECDEPTVLSEQPPSTVCTNGEAGEALAQASHPSPHGDSANSSNGEKMSRLSLQDQSENSSSPESLSSMEPSASGEGQSLTLKAVDVLSDVQEIKEVEEQMCDAAAGEKTSSDGQFCEPGITSSPQVPEPASLNGSGDCAELIKENSNNIVAPGEPHTGDKEGESLQPDVQTKDLNSEDILQPSSVDLPDMNQPQASVEEINPGSPSESAEDDHNTAMQQPDPPARESTSPEVVNPAEVADDEDESWLAVGEEDEAEGKVVDYSAAQQPDFFTTLSMNGLTQELASALTSLDGSPGSPSSSPDTPAATAIKGVEEHLG